MTGHTMRAIRTISKCGWLKHENGSIGGYTAARRPVTFVWSDSFPTRDEAYAAERRIKGWSRAKKEALIAGDWDRIRQLSRNRQS